MATGARFLLVSLAGFFTATAFAQSQAPTPALDGIATGVLLAIARVAGETAPLLFTSLGNLNWSTNLTEPMASLPVTIYQYAGSAFEDWVQLAWVGAVLITFGVLALNILARFILRPRS